MAKGKAADKKKRIKAPKQELTDKNILLPLIRNFEDSMEIIKLSKDTQRTIECIVNTNVTIENPWIYINKEKILDHLDLYPETSEFLPFQNEIKEYLESRLLFCLKNITHEDESLDTYFLCTTIPKKDLVVKMLSENEKRLTGIMGNILTITPNKWLSNGSEIEISQLKLRKNRPLYAIEIECDFPISLGDKKLTFLWARSEHGNTAEILPSDNIFKLIYRKRIDNSVQVTPEFTCNECQTTMINKQNRGIQSNNGIIEKIKYIDFSKKMINNVCEKILVNAAINFYIDDYRLLAHNLNPYLLPSAISTGLHYKNVKHGRKKFVTAVAWHPKLSGIIAVAYAKIATSCIIRQEPIPRKQELDKNIILIWSFSNCSNPTLVLHCDTEVMCLCFCPYKLCMLIAGCTNGQIAIWDLTTRFDHVKLEILSLKEHKHRSVMNSMMSWMKFEKFSNHIKPIAVSDYEFGHRSSIRSIAWISSNFQFTKCGAINKCEPEHELNGTQFLTCGMDDVVLVWDIQHNPKCAKTTTKKRVNSHRAILNISQDYLHLKKLNNVFVPLIKIIVKTNLPRVLLTDLVMIDQHFMFEISKQKSGRFGTTYFEPIKSNLPEKFEQKFTFATNLGALVTCSWDSMSYDQGNFINFYFAKDTISFKNCVHDSPILACVKHPANENVLLTVGGKIFAIWYPELDSKALMWRKRAIRYNSGAWSMNNACMLVLFRVDSVVEIWDLLFASNIPCRIIQQSGFATTDIFINRIFSHVANQTYFKTDELGNLILSTLVSAQSTKEDTEKQIDLFNESLHHILKRRQSQATWVAEWKKRYVYRRSENIYELQDEKIVTSAKKVVQVETVAPMKTAEELKWEATCKKQLRYILTAKGINLREIRELKMKRETEEDEKNKKKNKITELIGRKNSIFEFGKKSILGTSAATKRKSYYCNIAPGYSSQKQQLMENYLEIESIILRKLKFSSLNNKTINWGILVGHRKIISKRVFTELNKDKFQCLSSIDYFRIKKSN